MLQRLENVQVTDFTFKTEWKAVNMGNKLNIVSERGETIQVDPYLLFQRLTVIATHGKADMEPIFEYELCPYPASLAQSPMVPHFADKPKLFKNLEKYSLKTFPGMEYDVKYVLDGDDLLYKMGDWIKAENLSGNCRSMFEICHQTLWK